MKKLYDSFDEFLKDIADCPMLESDDCPPCSECPNAKQCAKEEHVKYRLSVENWNN